MQSLLTFLFLSLSNFFVLIAPQPQFKNACDYSYLNQSNRTLLEKKYTTQLTGFTLNSQYFSNGTPYCLALLWSFPEVFTFPSATPAFHDLPHFPLFYSSADSPHASQRKLKLSDGHASLSLANGKPACVFAHSFCLSSQPVCSCFSPPQGLSSDNLALFLLYEKCLSTGVFPLEL